MALQWLSQKFKMASNPSLLHGDAREAAQRFIPDGKFLCLSMTLLRSNLTHLNQIWNLFSSNIFSYLFNSFVNDRTLFTSKNMARFG
jgi:hypothetical protein